MSTLLRLLAALTFIAMLAGQSMAQATSDAQLFNFRWQLTDLAPNDDVTPSLTLTG